MKEFILQRICGKKCLQSFFDKMHRLALAGMNYGRSWNVRNSGKIEAIKYISRKLNTSSPIIFDVGAAKGKYSLQVLPIIPNAKLYCFEPLEDRFLILSESLNKCAHCYHFPLSSNDKTIDNFCRENDIQHINLLKIDTDGNDFDVLSGASTMIENMAIQFIQFEIDRYSIDSKVFLKDFYDLLSPRYRIFRIVQDGLVEIKNYEEIHEVFLCANYLAERK